MTALLLIELGLRNKEYLGKNGHSCNDTYNIDLCDTLNDTVLLMK